MALNLKAKDVLNWSVVGPASVFFLAAAVGSWGLKYLAVSHWGMWLAVLLSALAGFAILIFGTLDRRQVRMEKEAEELDHPLGYQGPQRRRPGS